MRIVYIFFFLIIVFCNYSYSQNSTKNITINKTVTSGDKVVGNQDDQKIEKSTNIKTTSTLIGDTLLNVYYQRRLNVQAQRKIHSSAIKKTINVNRKK